MCNIKKNHRKMIRPLVIVRFGNGGGRRGWEGGIGGGRFVFFSLSIKWGFGTRGFLVAQPSVCCAWKTGQ